MPVAGSRSCSMSGPYSDRLSVDGARHRGAGLVDGGRPFAGEALGLELGVELVAVELGRGAVRFDPEVELQVEIAVVVLAQLDQGPGEVDVVADGAIVVWS